MTELDQFDRKILTILTTNSRASVNEIAKLTALSPSATSRRIQALENNGVIKAYSAILDGPSIGLPITMFIEVRLKTLGDAEIVAFENAIGSIPNITDCYLMSGNIDYLLNMRVHDMVHYERMHRNQLSRLPNVERITTRFCIREVKSSGMQLNATP